MPIREPRYTKEDAARLANEIYERDIQSKVEPQHNEEIVAIDLDTGEWEMDPDEHTAAKKIEDRIADPQIFVIRVGSRYVRRFGGGRRIK